MCRPLCFSLFTLLAATSSALALSLRHEGSSSSAPFEIAYEDLQSPLEIVLQIANESESPQYVVAWQLIDLVLRPVGGANGSLLFENVAAPADSLFGQHSPEYNQLHSSTISVNDHDSELVGVELSQNLPRNILQLALTASPGTIGAFQLIVPQVENPDADSSWLGSDFTATAFDNSTASDLLLGTIYCFPPGDYNRDGHINWPDYIQWRADFGNPVPLSGNGADGNRNSVVDASDYVVWRNHLSTVIDSVGTTLPSHATSTTVPEPNALTLVIIWLAAMAGFHCRYIPRLGVRGAQVQVIL